MTDLDTELRTLGHELDWPPTPELAAAVRERLPTRAAVPSPRRRPARRRRAPRRVVVVLALLLLALPAAALAIPASRHAVLDALGLRHVTVQRRATPPHAARSPQLGTRTALAAGTLVPAALGAPDAVYRRGDIITLVYDHPRRLLAQARGRLPDQPTLRKIIAMDDRARRTTVRGRAALFLADPHAYAWSDVTGPPVRSGPALIWERGDTVLRLEGERDLARARAIAASVR
ncbi:hypothetical protein DSM104299_04913 [Baekduia alba]|uniref:hypothetical protein n=1 Tax=Baekduia alba TaxID=2997333 RepID=UPI00234228A8|nr:hypothetical protein [Baekduia alba]WCB96157.1 hypothetical protein DSM104299_04913 [Baekduia alba]